MNRIQEVFGVRRVLLPVIHPISVHEAMMSVELAIRMGCKGVFVIDQGSSAEEVLEFSGFLE